IVFRPREMEFTDHRAAVMRSFQHLRGCHLKGRDLRVGQVSLCDGIEHIRPERIAPLEEHCPARGAFGHGPDIPASHPRVPHGVEDWSGWRLRATVTESAELVDTDVIEDDEQDVRVSLPRPVGRLSQCSWYEARDQA